jgi:hypothetical protein
LRTIAKLYTVLALAVAYVTLNTWAKTQHAEFDLPLNVFKSFGHRGVLLFSIPFISTTLAISFWLAEQHARSSNGKNWRARFPRAFHADLDVDVSSPVGIWYQRFFFSSFVIFPIAGLVHFSRLFFKQKLNPRGDYPYVSVFHSDWNAALDARAYKFDGESFYPAWQPWLYLLLLAFAAYRFCRMVLALQSKRLQASKQADKSSADTNHKKP